MKKIISLLFVLILSFFLIIPAGAKEKTVTVYFFHGDGCPHCASEEKMLKRVSKKVKVVKYEVWYNTDNEELMNKIRSAYNIEAVGVPLTIIGDSYFVGYSDSIGNTINRAIAYYVEHDYNDEVSKIIDGTFEEHEIVDKFAEMDNSQDKFFVKIPFFGKVNLKKISILSASVIIGLIDGFNPCAMWVLLFLISVLIGMKDKKKMLTLGLAFLLTSALVYMLIMFSWLNIVVKISTSILIRNIIGIFAIVGGIINLSAYLKSNKSGCTVVDDKKRKKIFKSIRKFTSEKSFILALGGVIALAISVNLVELACSAGLPLVFTQLLAMNNVSKFSGFMYTLVYVFFFLIDDLIIFLIAMFTMNVTGISTKYNKYSHLIGGFVMLIIGLLLIFNYKLLTFGF